MKKVSFIPFKYTNLVGALETITVPTPSVTNNFIIDWGDGSPTEHITTTNPSHEYVDADSYQISITGTMLGFRFSNVGNRLNVTSFDQFGNTGLTDVGEFAQGCANCTLINGDDFDTSGITILANFADGCSSLVTFNVGTWVLSSATSISTFVRNCPLLEILDVSSWGIPNVTNTARFAEGCSNLITLNTNSWDTRSITLCFNMAINCGALTSSFDQYRWWNRTDDLTPGGAPDPIATFSNTFTNAFNISNYADIPNNWKGL